MSSKDIKDENELVEETNLEQVDNDKENKDNQSGNSGVSETENSNKNEVDLDKSENDESENKEKLEDTEDETKTYSQEEVKEKKFFKTKREQKKLGRSKKSDVEKQADNSIETEEKISTVDEKSGVRNLGENSGDNPENEDDFIPLGKKKWYVWVVDILYWIAMLPFKLLYLLLSVLKACFNLLCVLFVVGCIAGVLIFAKVTPMLQEAREQAYDKLAHISEKDFILNENTVIYDKKGKVIGEIESGKFVYKPIEEISDYIQKGYVAIEDKNYYLHAGVDYKATLRAGLSLLLHKGEITQGGSTITQQLIKNNLLSQEQTYSRKLTEVLLAPYVEQKFSKVQIMEYYCNSNYYGNQCYGVEAACQYYFGKSAKEVDISEAAMIAGMSNAPNDYNPIDNYDLAVKRRDKVLKAMKEEGYITQQEYDVAVCTTPVIHKDSSKTASSSNYMASYALYCAALELMEQDGFEFKYAFETEKEYEKYEEDYENAYAEKARIIRDGGYKIYTSLDSSLQKKLQECVKEGLVNFVEKDEDTGKLALQGAAVCVDNKTGYVVAVVGGRSSKDEYNRAFLSTRQPGSTIKPLLDYAPAIENTGLNGSSIVEDKQVFARNGDEENWSPKNFGGGYRGRVTVREALARSLNTVAFQLYQKVGSGTALNYLANMKFSSLSDVDNSAASVSLGGFTNGVKIVDMAKGYSTLAMNGKYTDRTCLVNIKYQDEDIYTESENISDDQEEVYTEDTAFIMQDMLQGVFNERYGTARSAYNSNQVYAGKTGTTNDSKDAWFCGFSKYYTTAVWMGYDTPRTMSGVTGASYPLTIWKTFMNDIHQDLKKADFKAPDTVKLCRVRNGEFTDVENDLQTKDSVDEEDEILESDTNLEDEELEEEEEEVEEEVKKSNSKYTYYLRKKGYDYYSTLNTEKAITYQNEQELKRAERRCEKMVSEFELYEIKDVVTALGLDDEYDKVMDVIESMPDVYKQKDFRKRAKKKYDMMNEVIVEIWETAIKEYNQEQEEIRLAEMEKQADDSRTAGYTSLKNSRINRCQWYINAINSRSYYNKLTRRLIKDSTGALARCKGYSEYDKLKSDLERAVDRAKDLPEEPEHNDIPKDKTDDETNSDRNDKYQEDKKTTEAQTTTETPVTEAPTTEIPTTEITPIDVQPEQPVGLSNKRYAK